MRTCLRPLATIATLLCAPFAASDAPHVAPSRVGPPREAASLPPHFFVQKQTGFPEDEAPWYRRAFDLVSTDMDQDGDPDLLVNWHHHEPLELYENRRGRFALQNGGPRDTSGLYDNPDVVDLFASQDVMRAKIEEADQNGLYVWHDLNRGGSWRFAWRNREAGLPGLELSLETSLPIQELEGLAAGEGRLLGERELEISISAEEAERRFAVRATRVATQLQLRPKEDRNTLPVFVGTTAVRMPEGPVSLWKPDPHGMAWVDVGGSKHPELFITRGALGGTLASPADPKTDRYYEPTGGRAPMFAFAPEGVVPAGYGRGRRVEWVDVDGQGHLALSIANEQSPNQLLVRQEQGQFRDDAPRRGLDLEGAAVQAWGDLEGDGKQDLFFLADGRIDVRRNTGGAFRAIDGESLGLVLPPAEQRHGVIDPAALRLADLDNDGDLDLWLLGYGGQGSVHVFRRDAGAFEEVSSALGLHEVRGIEASVLLDFDNDGFEDLALFGDRPSLWRNNGGRHFELHPLPGGRVAAAAAVDVDGDGWTDIVAMSRRRLILRNRALGGNRWLDIVLNDPRGEPIGALVRVYYDDGSVRVQRYGSATSSAFSQSLAPLRFGIPADRHVERLAVRWPGTNEEKSYAAPARGSRVVLER